MNRGQWPAASTPTVGGQSFPASCEVASEEEEKGALASYGELPYPSKIKLTLCFWFAGLIILIKHSMLGVGILNDGL